MKLSRIRRTSPNYSSKPLLFLFFFVCSNALSASAIATQLKAWNENDEDREAVASSPFQGYASSSRSSTKAVRPDRNAFGVRKIGPLTVGSLSGGSNTSQTAECNSMYLSDRAVSLFQGNPDASSFVERLRIQEEEEEEKRHIEIALQSSQRHHSGENGFVQLTTFGGAAVLAGVSLHMHGSPDILQTTLQDSVAALLLAWIPSLLLCGGSMGGMIGWEVVVPFVGLWLQPSTRYFLRSTFIPSLFNTWMKMFWSEVWRRAWAVLMAPLPKLLLVPDISWKRTGSLYWKARSSHLPKFVRKGLQFVYEMVDKWTQSLMRKTIQKSVQASIGVFYDNVVEWTLVMDVNNLVENDSTDMEEIEPCEINVCDNDVLKYEELKEDENNVVLVDVS